jgi:hypothetical protein
VRPQCLSATPPTADNRVRAELGGGILELAFPSDALEGLLGVLDPVLIVGAIGGKQPHDLVGAVGSHMAGQSRREVHVLTDLKPMFFQRCLLHSNEAPVSQLPPIGRQYSSKSALASKKSAFRPSRQFALGLT